LLTLRKKEKKNRTTWKVKSRKRKERKKKKRRKQGKKERGGEITKSD
jgi:hypothetical protein